jgi:hypothetical protein
MVEPLFKPVPVPAGADGRITIPFGWCQRLPWATGDETLLVWLLMLVPGRFRLLSDPEVQQDPALNEIRSVLVDGPTLAAIPATTFDPSGKAALVGRLIPTSLSPGASWRLIVPKQGMGRRERNEYVLMFSLGYLELWFAETYAEALTAPLDAVI